MDIDYNRQRIVNFLLIKFIIIKLCELDDSSHTLFYILFFLLPLLIFLFLFLFSFILPDSIRKVLFVSFSFYRCFSVCLSIPLLKASSVSLSITVSIPLVVVAGVASTDRDVGAGQHLPPQGPRHGGGGATGLCGLPQDAAGTRRRRGQR